MARFQAVVIALAALILAPGYLFYFDITPKLTVLLAGTAVTTVWAAWAGARIVGRPRWFFAFSLLLLLNILSLAISTAVSTRPGLSLFGTNWRRFGSVSQAALYLFGWLVALICAGRPQRVRAILRAVAVAGALSGAYGIAQYFGWDPLLPAASYHVGEGIFTIVRPPGTLGYASYFATWLVLALFLNLALRTAERSAGWRRFAAGSALLAGLAMVLTGTRAAVLGLAAGGMVWMAVERVRIPRRALVAGGLALIAAAGFYFAPPGRQLRARMHWFTEDPWGGARLELWRDSLDMAAPRLLAGYGPETFTAAFPRFESLQLARAYPNFAHESPHNIFLDALVAQGLPGLLVFAALCAVPLLAAFRLKQAAVAAALTAGLVSQQFTAFTAATAMIFWVTAAMAVAVTTPPAEPRRRAPVVAGAGVVALALIYIAARFTMADHALALTERRLEEGDLARAAEQYGRYENARLPGGTADIWYSRALLGLASRAGKLQVRLSAVNAAGAATLRATQSADDAFNAWYNRAVFCGSQNDSACVERSLREAIAANPMWFKPHWALAEVLRLTGRLEEAQREAMRAAELDAGKDPEVARTLQQIRVAQVNSGLQK